MSFRLRTKKLLGVLCLIFLLVSALMLPACTGSNNYALPGAAFNTAPVAVIQAPLGGSISREGTVITFSGTGQDTGEGMLAGGALVWTSDIDGQIGTGTAFNTTTLTRTTHVITLTATDASGLTATDSITLIVVGAWFDPLWGYRQMITIDAGMAPSDQTDFQVIIKLTDGANPLFGNAQPDADDILFTEDDGVTQLDHEIEYYMDTGTEELDAWVKIPDLLSASDTIVYMYYGNVGASNQENTAGVWSNNYVGVWHLSESIGQHADSTSNGYDSYLVTASQQGQTTEAMIGGADFFTPLQRIMVADPGVDSALDMVGNTPMTLQAWIRPDSFLWYQNGFITKNYTLRLDGPNMVGGCSNDTALVGTRQGRWSGDASGTCGTIDINEWYQVVFVYEVVDPYIAPVNPGNDRAYLYINGQLDASGTSVWGDAAGVDDPGDFCIHSGWWGCDSTGNSGWGGYMDEVRVSSAARSADWILTEYNNQNNPAGFLTFNPEEPF